MTPRSWLRALSWRSGLLAGGWSTGCRAWSRKRRTARALSAAPQVDEVVVWVGRGEHVDGRGEDLLLGGEQRLVVESDPVRSWSLTSSSVRTSRRCCDGFVEPPFGEPAPGRGGGEDDSVATAAGGLAAAGDQAFVDEAVDRPVGERPAERPDPTDLTVGCEQRSERPPVGDLLGDQAETDALGEVTGHRAMALRAVWGLSRRQSTVSQSTQFLIT